MAIVTGKVVKPNGETLIEGIVEFTLTDSVVGLGGVIPSDPVVASTDQDGEFSVDLWPNADYELPSAYSFKAYDRTDYGKGAGYDFGRVVVPAAGGDIADIAPLMPRPRVSDTAVIAKGDTFTTLMYYVDANGYKVPLDGYSITAYIIPLYGDPVPVSVTVESASDGLILIVAPTAELPLGVHRVNVSFENDGIVKTQRGKIKVVA